MEINEKNIKMFSTIGPRATLGLAALEIAKKDNSLIIITCDVSTSAGLDRFRKTFPEKYFDLGIAEQNMIGVATGLASENFKVVTTTFAPFQTMRCCEQIKVNLGYMNQKVCMVGIASGLALGTLGYTHCCIEDIGVLRSMPGITIISPADSLETVKSLQAAINYSGPTYIRLTGKSNNPIVNKTDYNFEIGKSITIKEGKDISIFATGSMVYQAIKAAEILAQKKIFAKVINMHTIKPLDKSIIKESLDSSLIVSIEEHNIIGGLGSAISEYLSTQIKKPKQVFIGIEDTYTKGGEYEYLLQKHGLTEDAIANKIIKELDKN
tara:strand:+ start:3351 stop:4319 length:969 start_codon:yes stop_codon:yes gene_type:complete